VEANEELEALQTSTSRVRDLVLDNVDGPSSLAVAMSTAVELLEGQIDTTGANGDPFCVGCHCVTFPRGEDQAGGAWVQTERRLDRG
jgi:hypothetical protein